MGKGLGEQLVGSGQILLAVAEQHAGPAVEGRPRRLGHHCRLAQARLARDEEDLASSARSNLFCRIGDRRHLGIPAHHTDRRVHGQTTGERNDLRQIGSTQRLPDHLDGLDGHG